MYSSNSLKIYTCDFERLNFNEECLALYKDWILTAKWVDEGKQLATVSMHNVLTVWSANLQKLNEFFCEEKCILYSSLICHENWQDLIVLSGTVFSEVLIWWPAKSDGKFCCNVLHRLQGHKVNVRFFVEKPKTANDFLKYINFILVS